MEVVPFNNPFLLNLGGMENHEELASEHPTNPCPAPIPEGQVQQAIPEELLRTVVDELRGIRADLSALGDMRQLVKDLVNSFLNLEPRVAKLEHDAAHGFGICKYHHDGEVNKDV